MRRLWNVKWEKNNNVSEEADRMLTEKTGG